MTFYFIYVGDIVKCVFIFPNVLLYLLIFLSVMSNFIAFVIRDYALKIPIHSSVFLVS